MRGIGLPQAQMGSEGLLVSGRVLGQMLSPPIDIGNRQDQHTSVIGLTNLPVQRDCAWAEGGNSATA